MRLLVDFQWHWNSSKNRIKTVVLGKCLGSYGEGIERRPQPESAFDEIGIPIHNPTFHATQTAFQLNSQIPFSPLFFFYFFYFFFHKKNGKDSEMEKSSGNHCGEWMRGGCGRAGWTNTCAVEFNTGLPCCTRRDDVVFISRVNQPRATASLMLRRFFLFRACFYTRFCGLPNTPLCSKNSRF